MFYCDPCGYRRNWPESISQSFGPCEICRNSRLCSNVPSYALPLVAERPSRRDYLRTLGLSPDSFTSDDYAYADFDIGPLRARRGIEHLALIKAPGFTLCGLFGPGLAGYDAGLRLVPLCIKCSRIRATDLRKAAEVRG